jgi:hypothetical protein
LGAITKYVDKDYWKNPNLKILDPAAGIGNFPLIAYELLMDGLRHKFPNEEARRKHILENMLYMVELNPVNARLMQRVFHAKKYRLNIIRDDFLANITQRKLSRVQFDLVMGNPPYQDANGASNGTLWDKFIKTSLSNLAMNGLLIFVNPSGWRNKDGKFKEIQRDLLSKKLIYLEIHNERDGLRTFASETRYDWYVLQNTPSDKRHKTIIKAQDGKIIKLALFGLDFIPNENIHYIISLIVKHNEKSVKVLYSRTTYGTDKSWMDKTMHDEFIHPCVYTVNSEDKPSLFFSTRKSDFFGVPKMIWSNGRITSVGSFVDREGKYGLTNFSYAIADEPKNLENIKRAFDSSSFRKVMEACAVGQNSINYKAISMMKHDFWKRFI